MGDRDRREPTVTPMLPGRSPAAATPNPHAPARRSLANIGAPTRLAEFVRVLITFDVEVWCNSWHTLDADFPASFERYVFGRSRHGAYALPKTLEILDRHGLRGVFFVEPLFASRFGVEPLARIVELVRDAGQEVQLHLHPEWTDEARVPLLPGVTGKRQFMHLYGADEQRALVAHGLRLMREAGVHDINAFRSGGFACNADTLRAVAANGLAFDSSINPTFEVSQPGPVHDPQAAQGEPFAFDGLTLVPMSVFRDGRGRLRHAQIGACSARELTDAMTDAARQGWSSFVLLSHNFEMLVPDKADPDGVVVRRFEAVCRFLAGQRGTLPTAGFHDLPPPPSPRGLAMPRAGQLGTAIRYAEQAWRRLH